MCKCDLPYCIHVIGITHLRRWVGSVSILEKEVELQNKDGPTFAGPGVDDPSRVTIRWLTVNELIISTPIISVRIIT